MHYHGNRSDQLLYFYCDCSKQTDSVTFRHAGHPDGKNDGLVARNEPLVVSVRRQCGIIVHNMGVRQEARAPIGEPQTCVQCRCGSVVLPSRGEREVRHYA